MSSEITNSWSQLGYVAVSAAAMLAAIVVVVRIVGLRSFSKMSSFDFAITVAMGSILASVAISGSSLVDGVAAVAMLLALQTMVSLGRSRWKLSALVDNRPVLLMAGSEMLTENMKRTRVTSDDLRAKLRAANVLDYDQIRFVVFETTGDVSVVTGDGALDPDILADVAGRDRVPRTT